MTLIKILGSISSGVYPGVPDISAYAELRPSIKKLKEFNHNHSKEKSC